MNIFSSLSTLLTWWGILFFIGCAFFPLALFLFDAFFDKGYLFGKFLGLLIVTYTVFFFGTLHVFQFTQLTSIAVTLYCIALLWIFLFFFKKNHWKNMLGILKKHWQVFFLEECLFLGLFLFWAYIRSFSPDARGIEKFMDFGFVNAVLRTEYFPVKDMWFTPSFINYYYFGHVMTALLTKVSGIPVQIAFNLMFATLFAGTAGGIFSLAANLFTAEKKHFRRITMLGTGILTAFLVTMAGNLQTVYAFFSPYQNETPVPFWQLAFKPFSFPNSYWYPNASRFIYHTIHEFPSYAFIVSDLHGHLLDTPFVILTIALLFAFFKKTHLKKPSFRSMFPFLFLFGFLLAALYMTNAWDGIIYFLLASSVVFLQYNLPVFHTEKKRFFSLRIIDPLIAIFFLFFLFIGFTLPFSLFFKPFASGIGILCAPQALTHIGHVGPFLFEPNHCQHSPWWQLLLLYGFFAFWLVPYSILFFRKKEKNVTDIFIMLLSVLSLILIIIPEFVYLKDIYPAHYRANTMFKLVYEAFIMLSLSTGYVIIQTITTIKSFLLHSKRTLKFVLLGNASMLYLLIGIVLFSIISVYPFLGINSYYGSLKTPIGLDGWHYLETSYQNDFQAIKWLRNLQGTPVVLEAYGDSYTDYGRVSSNTGLPTLLGWLDHEWLWHDSYELVSPRIPDIKTIYETTDIQTAKSLLHKYNVTLIYLSDLERQKYPALSEQKFSTLGKPAFQSGTTKIYQVNR